MMLTKKVFSLAGKRKGRGGTDGAPYELNRKMAME
jgi:hypothetical protein